MSLLSLFNTNLGGFIEVFGGQKAALAQQIRDAVFRDGVAPITSRPLVEQHELVKLLIRDLRHGELASARTLTSRAGACSCCRSWSRRRLFPRQ